MSAYPWLARHVLAPTLDILRGTRTMQRMGELERLQWWPVDRIREAQAQRLQTLISRSYECVPFYRRLMDERGIRPGDIRSSDDLACLPALTKNTIRAHLDDLLARDVPRERLRSGRSGGTTGERLDYFSTREERLTFAHARWLLSLEWSGAQFGEPHLSIRQMTAGTSGRATRMLHRASLRLQRLERIDTMSVTEENLPALVSHMQRTKPRSLFAYPSALALIASYARDHDLSCPAVHAVCLGGERLHDRQRAVLQQVFGSEPCIRYGSNELHSVAAQCEAHGGLHIHADDFIIEVVDDDGNLLSPGSRGRLLVTSLHNHGMPFIRYETGDIGALLPGACPCGRGLPLLDSLIGRTVERVYGANGRRVDAMDLDIGQALPPGVVHYQLVQETIDRFVLSVVPAAGNEGNSWGPVSGRVADIVASVTGSRPRIDLHLVDRIAMNLSGKRLPFISHMYPASARAEPDRR